MSSDDLTITWDYSWSYVSGCSAMGPGPSQAPQGPSGVGRESSIPPNSLHTSRCSLCRLMEVTREPKFPHALPLWSSPSFYFCDNLLLLPRAAISISQVPPAPRPCSPPFTCLLPKTPQWFRDPCSCLFPGLILSPFAFLGYPGHPRGNLVRFSGLCFANELIYSIKSRKVLPSWWWLDHTWKWSG